MARWVKLPDGAQVTMSNGDYERLHTSIGPFGWLVLIGVAILALMVFGNSADKSDAKNNKPNPHTSTSAPAKVGGSHK